MNTHELKIQSDYFEEVVLGNKRAEVRRDDRCFKVGDILILKEVFYCRETVVATGREVSVEVTHKMEGGKFGIKSGFCVLSFKISRGFEGSYSPNYQKVLREEQLVLSFH